MKTYVISLNKHGARYKSLNRLLEFAKIDHEFISAFDGRHKAKKDLPRYSKFLAITLYGRPLMGGEVGCYLSHIQVIENFLASDEQFCLVLEDDATFDQSGIEAIKNLSKLLQTNSVSDWDIINIDNIAKPGRSQYISKITDTHALHRCWSFPKRCAGIIWSREGAIRFLKMSDKIYAPIDQVFAHKITKTCRGLCCNPAIVKQVGESDILGSGISYEDLNKKRSLWYKIVKKIRRRIISRNMRRNKRIFQKIQH